MSELVTLQLYPNQPGYVERRQIIPSEALPERSRIHTAFFALLAANVFLVSGALCFGVLYFTN